MTTRTFSLLNRLHEECESQDESEKGNLFAEAVSYLDKLKCAFDEYDKARELFKVIDHDDVDYDNALSNATDRYASLRTLFNGL